MRSTALTIAAIGPRVAAIIQAAARALAQVLRQRPSGGAACRCKSRRSRLLLLGWQARPGRG